MEGSAREIDRAIRRDTSNTGASRSGSDPSPSESFHSIDERLGDPQPSTSKPYTPAALTRPKVKAVVIQGPDGALYVGNQHVAAKLGRTAQSSAAEDGRASFDFASAAEGTAAGLAAVHIIMPDPPPSSESVTIDIQGMGAIFSPVEITIYRRRKQAFIAMLCLAFALYIVVFSAGLTQKHRGSSCRKKSSSKMMGSIDCLSRALLSNRNIVAALAYLTLYLSLGMVGFAGAVVDSPNLLLLFILVESCLTFASALRGLRPFLVFRILLIFLAFQVRRSLMLTLDALRRLQAQITGQPVPPPAWAERRWNELMVRPRAVARRIFTIPMAFQRGQAMQRENPVAPVQPLVRDEGL